MVFSIMVTMIVIIAMIVSSTPNALKVRFIQEEVDGLVISHGQEIRWDFASGLDDLGFLMEVFPCSKALLSYRLSFERCL